MKVTKRNRGVEEKKTHHRLLLQRIHLILEHKRSNHRLHARLLPLDLREEDAPKLGVRKHGAPARRVPVDTPAHLLHMRGLGVPQPAAHKGPSGGAGLAVEVVARVGPLAPRARPGGRKVRLVRRRVLAEARVAVDAEDDVLGRQLGDRGVGGRDRLRRGVDKRLPVFKGPAVLAVVGCAGGG